METPDEGREPSDPTSRHRPGGVRRSLRRPVPHADGRATEDEPKRRLESQGPEALSTPELLGVLLAAPGRAATELARRLLDRPGGLRRLASCTPVEARASLLLDRDSSLRLSAAFALAHRALAERLRHGTVFKTSGEIFEAYHGRLRDLKKERFLTVLLDAKNRVLRETLVSEGSLTASLVHPREVFAPAIRESAGGLLLVHNHPSGDPEPSPEDHEITQRLCAVGEIVGIRVLDHVVIGDGAYVSFLERGLLPP